MPNLFTVEELVIDDSFYCYCLNTTDDENIHTSWQRYATENPSEKKNIEEARLIVLGLHSMLQQRKSTSSTNGNPLGSVSQTSHAVNSVLMACTLYSSRIAFGIIGFCITALLAVYSIPLLQSAAQPGVFRQLPVTREHCISVTQPLFSQASGQHFLPISPFKLIASFAERGLGIAGASHNNSLYYKQSCTGKASAY